MNPLKAETKPYQNELIRPKNMIQLRSCIDAIKVEMPTWLRRITLRARDAVQGNLVISLPQTGRV